jgi:predicted DsbA family dithiol-disulfide isomerase
MRDYVLEVEWLPYELHPEMPIPCPGGDDSAGEADVALPEWHFVFDLLEPDSPAIRLPRVVANTHLALEATEYAREHGRFDAFHRGVFRAYFVEAQDIGQPEVLRKLGYEAGLDGTAMVAAALEHRYHDRLTRIERDRRWYGLIGTPTFIVGTRMLVGAHSYVMLASMLEDVGAQRRPKML